MTGSTADIIAIVIVALIALAFLLGGVYYADSHPTWRGQAGAGTAPGLEGLSQEEYEAVVRAAYEGAVGASPAGSVPAQREDTVSPPPDRTVPAPRGETEPAPHETRQG